MSTIPTTRGLLLVDQDMKTIRKYVARILIVDKIKGAQFKKSWAGQRSVQIFLHISGGAGRKRGKGRERNPWTMPATAPAVQEQVTFSSCNNYCKNPSSCFLPLTH